MKDKADGLAFKSYPRCPICRSEMTIEKVGDGSWKLTCALNGDRHTCVMLVCDEGYSQ